VGIRGISEISKAGKYSITVWVYEKYRRFRKQGSIPLLCGYTRNIRDFENREIFHCCVGIRGISEVSKARKYSITVWVYEEYQRFRKQGNIPLLCGYTRNIRDFENREIFHYCVAILGISEISKTGKYSITVWVYEKYRRFRSHENIPLICWYKRNIRDFENREIFHYCVGIRGISEISKQGNIPLPCGYTRNIRDFENREIFHYCVGIRGISEVSKARKYSITVWVYEEYQRFRKQGNIPLLCGYTRNIRDFENREIFHYCVGIRGILEISKTGKYSITVWLC
jgi:hypothetical protein